MRLTPKQVYDKLLDEDKILTLEGQIRFELGNVNIIVKQRDVVGNIIQEWLEGWFKENKIDYATEENTQMPPDFYLEPGNKTHNLLEVKAFNYDAQPGFDIADFKMFSEELIKKPFMLDVDYLIFGYTMSDDGVVVIKDLWLKKVWQILRPMTNYPINLQIKRDEAHKIRPGVWYEKKGKASRKSDKNIPIFSSLEDFLSAFEETVYVRKETHQTSSDWKKRFVDSYKKFFNKEIDFPRWSEIRNKYYK